MAFCNRLEKDFRIAIGSFIENKNNKVEIVRLSEEHEEFEPMISFDHEYPPTKL